MLNFPFFKQEYQAYQYNCTAVAKCHASFCRPTPTQLPLNSHFIPTQLPLNILNRHFGDFFYWELSGSWCGIDTDLVGYNARFLIMTPLEELAVLSQSL
jgi:hypothetical protein